MADFRKWFLAFAVLAFVVIPVSAQANPPLSCTANSGVPPILRSEGLTESVGDVVINCTGGTPTAAGQPMPVVNVQVFLSSPITSRITASGSGVNWSAALLLIDEPRPSWAGGATDGSTPYPLFRACGAPDGALSTCAMLGTGGANTAVTGSNYVGPYTGGGPGTTINGVVEPNGTFNVWQGQYQNLVNGTSSSVAFLGVPFDAPGTTGGTRSLRITNIRTAPGAPSSSFVPQPVVEYISISGSTALPLNNPQQIVGYSQNGIDQNAGFIGNGPITFSTCSGQNTVSGGAIQGDGAQFVLTAAEGFATSFKVRNITQVPNPAGGGFTNISQGATGNPLDTGYTPQDIPGIPYNTETGFLMLTDVNDNGHGIQVAGRANQGTRLMFNLGNLPTGGNIFVPNVVPLFQRGNFNRTTGFAVLVATDATGASATNNLVNGNSNLPIIGSTVSATAAQLGHAFGGGNATAFTEAGIGPNGGLPVGIGAAVNGVGLVQLTPTSGAVMAVYEIVMTDTSILEQLSLPVFVGFNANAPTISQTATGSVNFAPISTDETPLTAKASSSRPIPRFLPSGRNGNPFSFAACFCNILFPYVTASTAGGAWETGIAIANTTLDPFGTTPAGGTVTLNFYGTGSTATTGQTGFQVTTGSVPAGGVLVFTLGNGNGAIYSAGAQTGTGAPVPVSLYTGLGTGAGIAPSAGFTGYVIAQARFQYCHGYAFVMEPAATGQVFGAAASYLGLIMDTPGAYRTGNSGENLGN